MAGLVGCHDANPIDPASNNSAGTVNPGVNLSADQAEIVIDTTDPNAPTDPMTNLRIGTTTITALVTDAAGDPQPDVAVVFATSAGTLASAGMPVNTDQEGLAMDTLTVDEEAPAEIEVTGTAGEMIGTLVVPLRLILPNSPPVADAGADQTIECASPTATPVTLDGSASSDPDSTEETDDIVSWEWFEFYGAPEQVSLGEGAVLDVGLPPGVHTITLVVTDSAGATATDETVVTIVDTTPPDVTVVLDPSVLWPPNHKLIHVHADVRVMDACSAAPLVELISVTSNEPDNGLGDGDTADDIQSADIGSDDSVVWLRAERAGVGSGRVYTVTYRVSDDSGPESTEASAEVRVPHNQGH